MAPNTRDGDAAQASPVPSSPPQSAGAPARLTVALVRGLRGLKGQVRVELLTDRPEDRFGVGARLIVEGTPQVLTIAESSAVADGPGWWLRFREITTREAADTLRDRYLEIEPVEEERQPGQWFFHELVGLAVRSTEGEDLGKVYDIYRAGGAEVFVVRGPRGEIDVPGVKGIVTDLAPDRGELVVDMTVQDHDARPVDDEDYVRPRDRRPKKQAKPKGPAQPPKGTHPAKPAKGAKESKPAGEGAASADAATPPAKAPKPIKTKLPKGATGTYTLTPEEIAQAMAAAGMPMPSTSLPKPDKPPSSSD